MPVTPALANLALLLLSSLLFVGLYARSVGPARRALKTGPSAYAHCARYRTASIVFMCLACLAYVGFALFPVETGLPATFAWGWPVSIGIGAALTAFATWVMTKAARAAGAESFVPGTATTLYGGIYTRIRHPQAIGDTLYFFALAFFLNAPFLVAYSLIWLPAYYLVSRLEERDLLVRFGDDYAAYMRRTGMFVPRRSARG